MRGDSGVRAANAQLVAGLADDSPYVRIVAAEALRALGGATERSDALRTLAGLCDWSKNDVFVAIAALNAVDACGNAAESLAGTLRHLPRDGRAPDNRYRDYVPRLLEGWK